MTESLHARPRNIPQKQRPTETARRKRRKFPPTKWKGGVSPLESTVNPARGPILGSASVQESMKPLPQEDKAAFETVVANALKLIQAQQSETHVSFKPHVTLEMRVDDISRYGISLEQESKLRELEIRRLVTAIRTNIDWNPFGYQREEMWHLDDAGFSILSRLTEEINMNIAICNFDNSFSCLDESERRGGVYIKAPFRNAQLLRDSYQKRLQSGETANASSTNDKVTAERTRRFYCALIDYITTVAARCASHNVLDEAWHSRVVASLAKCAAKMKFLAIDSEYFAHQSLALVEGEENESPVSYVVPSDKNKVNESYQTSSWAFTILSSILGQLNADSISKFLRKSSNISTVIYRTGWKDVPVALDQNHRGEIYGTSSRIAVRIIQGAFYTLHQVAQTIQHVKSSERADASKSTCRISFQLDIRWHYLAPSRGDHAGPMEGYIETLFDFVSIIVPLLSMGPEIVRQLNHFPDNVTEISSISVYLGLTHASVANFSAFAELKFHTGPVDSATEMRDTQATFKPMSNFLMFEDASWQDIDRRKSDRQRSSARIWVIEEKAIVVSRQFFVKMTLTACGILVVGGILAGFLVGERIPGVDPFNIATFTWVLAAFVILIAKSLSVREWPWRDFLRGEVACRSVSELHAVTGVDEQEILEYLLAKDAHTLLTTRGPFNMLFSRKSDDGFSIDVKLELRTLIASGIVVVGVATSIGPALVCLDFRRGMQDHTSVSHSDGIEDGESLFGSYDFPETIDDDDSDIPLQKLPAMMKWTRILGLYSREDKKFR